MIAISIVEVEKKIKKGVNIALPPDIWDAFREQQSKFLNGKAMWIGVAAALLMFMEAAEDERIEFADRINRAELRGDYASLFDDNTKSERPFREAARKKQS